MGAASTTSTVCRTFVAKHGTTADERARHTAVLSACTSFGFVLGPAIGGLIFLLPVDRSELLRTPGWIGSLLVSMAGAAAGVGVGKERPRSRRWRANSDC